MNTHFSTRYVLIAAALTLTVAVSLTLTGAASAQSTGVEVSANDSTPEPEPVEGRVGPIIIEDYELRGDTFTLSLNVTESTPYAISGAYAGIRSEGVTEVPSKQGALREGRQTLKLTVTVIEGAGGVTLSTGGSVVRITSGALTVGGAMIPARTVRMLIIATVLGSVGFTYRTVRNKRDDETKDVEKIL